MRPVKPGDEPDRTGQEGTATLASDTSRRIRVSLVEASSCVICFAGHGRKLEQD